MSSVVEMVFREGDEASEEDGVSESSGRCGRWIGGRRKMWSWNCELAGRKY